MFLVMGGGQNEEKCKTIKAANHEAALWEFLKTCPLGLTN